MEVLIIRRKLAVKYEFEIESLMSALFYLGIKKLERGKDYEFGYYRGDDFPSTLVVLNPTHYKKLRKMLKKALKL